MQQSLLLFEHDVFKVTNLAQVAACPPPQRFWKNPVLTIARFCAALLTEKGHTDGGYELPIVRSFYIYLLPRTHKEVKNRCYEWPEALSAIIH
jgi:hypothetical protein